MAALRRSPPLCTSVKTLLLFALAVGGASVTVLPETAPAQNERRAVSCTDTLSVAEEAYRNRDYQEAVMLASQCTDLSSIPDTTVIRAHRLVALASLRQGALVQGRAAVSSILKIDPDYTADPINDPPSYDLFVSMVRGQVSSESSADERPRRTQADAERPDIARNSNPEPIRPQRTGQGLFLKFGGGLSDYTGDLPIQNVGHPFDLQELNTGSGFPYFLSVELGYQISSNFALVLGFASGNYPIVGYATGSGDISDSGRHTPQLLGRYTFGTPGESLTLYLDGGLNVTFGGEGTANTGYGPSVGGGVDIPLSNRLSFYVESRLNLTLPDDAIDGTSYPEDGPDGSSPKGSITGPFDSVNQLLGIGLRLRFGGTPDSVQE